MTDQPKQPHPLCAVTLLYMPDGQGTQISPVVPDKDNGFAREMTTPDLRAMLTDALAMVERQQTVREWFARMNAQQAAAQRAAQDQMIKAQLAADAGNGGRARGRVGR